MKSILRTFMFLLILVILYYLCYILLFRIEIKKDKPLVSVFQNELISNYYNSYYTFSRLDTSKVYDYIFIGSSHTYHSFDPQIFEERGYESYNLGSTNQTPLNSYYLLEYLPIHTKKLILEIYPEASNNSGKESFFDLVNNLTGIKPLLGMSAAIWDLRCFNLLSIHPILHNYNRTHSILEPENDRGYVGYDSVLTDTNRVASFVLNTGQLDKQLKYIQRIIDWCKSKNIEAILVYAPIPHKHKLIHEDYFTDRIQILSTGESILFINKGRNHDLNDHLHFYDDNHLNTEGVRIFNHLLLEELK